MKTLTEEDLSLVEFRAKNAGDEDVLDLIAEVREHRRAAGGVHPRLQQAMGEAVAETIVELQQECIAAKNALRGARDSALDEAAEKADGGPLRVRGVLMTPRERILALKSKQEGT